MDPFTIMAITSGVKALGGGIQALASGERKRQKELASSIEAIPEYAKSPSILNYFQQAQQRAAISPTQTALYKRQMENLRRTGASTLAGLRSSRERLGATPAIMRSMADASLGAEAAAEQEQNRRFSQYGQATGMQAGEERAAELRKFQKQQQRIALAEARAQGAAAVKRAGLTNIFGAITDIGKAYMNKDAGKK